MKQGLGLLKKNYQAWNSLAWALRSFRFGAKDIVEVSNLISREKK